MIETCTFGGAPGHAGRVRPGRAGPRDQPGRGPHRPRGGRQLLHPRPPPVRGRLDRAGHQVPVAGPDPLRRAARPVRGAGPGPARRRRRRHHHRDLLRPAVHQGRHDRRPAGHGRGRPPGPPAGAGHDGADRAHAAGHRDRRRPVRPRRHEARPHRHQLRHRARSRWASTCATCPSTPACPSRASPTPACPRWSTATCTTTSRPRVWPSTCVASWSTWASTSSAAAAAPPRPTWPRWSTPARGSSARPATRSTRPAPPPSTRWCPFHQDTSFLIIGERTNANGSKKFREALLAADWDTTVAMAKDQVKEGAHVLDVCVDYVGRDGTVDMDEVGVALRHPGQRAAGARLDRAPGHGGGAAVAGRSRHPQLGQPRGRLRARARASTGCSTWPASTARR